MGSWHQKFAVDCGTLDFTFNRADGGVGSAFSKKPAKVEAECVWLASGQLDSTSTYSSLWTQPNAVLY